MQLLQTIGLDSYEDCIRVLDNYTELNGKIYTGYSGEYHYSKLGDAEFNFHYTYDTVGDVDKALIGFSSHVMGDNVWELVISGKLPGFIKIIDNLSKTLWFHGLNYSNNIFPVRLIHSDVLPCFAPGEKVVMQVIAFPYEIHYGPKQEKWAVPEKYRSMSRNVRASGNITGEDPHSSACIIEATVKNIEKRTSIDCDSELVDFYCVTVQTAYGDLEICHTQELVAENERQFIKIGARVWSRCVVQGDVAIEEYLNGAVYDEEHCLKLLKECFETVKFDRSRNAFAEDADLYVTKDGPQTKVSGKEAVINSLQESCTAKKQPGTPIYCEMVRRDLSADDGGKRKLVYSRKLLLLLCYAYSETPCYEQLLYIKMNAKNRIQEVFIFNLPQTGDKS